MRKTHLYRKLEVKAHRMVGQHRHNKSDPKGSRHDKTGVACLSCMLIIPPLYMIVQNNEQYKIKISNTLQEKSFCFV